MLTNPLSPPESVSMDTSGNMEPTMMRVMTVCLLPREAYAAGGAVPCGDAKGCVRVEVPYSVTMRDLAAELVRATSAPTATMHVREWLGMNAHRNAEDDAARVSAVHMYVADCSASESGESGESGELVPVPPLTRVEEVASLAHDGSISGHPELTVYYAQDHKFGDDEDMCLACCAICACCIACCAASSAVNAASSANKPQPQTNAPPNYQGQYNYSGNNENMYVAQPQNNYGQPQSNYGQPQNNYGQTQNNYGQPQNIYGQPQNNYGQPQNTYGQPQNGNYAPPLQQYGLPVAGQPVQSANGGYPSPQYANNNTNNNGARATSYGQHTSADYPGTRADTVDPQEIVFSPQPPSPPPAAGAAPEFSPAEGRDEFDYPTERPPLASSDGGLPPPQYKLSGFDNGSATFDEAKKPGK